MLYGGRKLTYYIELSDKRNELVLDFIARSYVAVEYNALSEKEIDVKDSAIVFSPAKRLVKSDILQLPSGVKVFGGKQDDVTMQELQAKNIEYQNILENEAFAIKNAKLTAEGALSLVIKHTKKSLYDSKILVLGCGRVGKAMALILKQLGVKVNIATYDKFELDNAWLYADSVYYKDEYARELVSYDLIINTIPANIISSKMANSMADTSVVLELASTNCIDDTVLACSKFEFVKAAAMPMVFSPISAAKIMAEAIISNI